MVLLLATVAVAQDKVADTLYANTVVVNKDPRLDILARKELEYNALALHSAKGFRLLVLSSNDREKVMSVRAKLLQQYPDQKVYMTFQAPYIKLKMGNFVEKADAEKFRDQLMGTHISSTNIYVVPEMVEVKADKLKEKEEPDGQ